MSGQNTVSLHRNENGNLRPFGMHPEKLFAWLLRAIVALLLFIWHDDGRQTREQLEQLRSDISKMVVRVEQDHDRTVELWRRAAEHERRLEVLEPVVLSDRRARPEGR